MKIVIIYGTERKGSTYNITQEFLRELRDTDDDFEIKEFFLPSDMPNFCRGCFNCFNDYTKCPDYKYINPILKEIEIANIIIFTSPVYVYHITGQLKAFLDHFGFQWMCHQPNENMFNKQVLVISTAAGAGTKSAIKDVLDSMTWWGIGRQYKYGVNVAAASWKNVSKEKKAEISKSVKIISKKIKKDSKNVKPSIKVKMLFYAMRFMQRKYAFNEVDVRYWKRKGWLENRRPWK